MTIRAFRYASSVIKTRQLAALFTLLLLPLPIILLLLAWLVADRAGLDALIETLPNTLGDDALLVVAVLGVAALVLLSNLKIRLAVNDSALTVHVPKLTGLGLAGLTTGDHRIPMDRVQAIRLTYPRTAKALAPALQQARLELVTAQQTYRFQPYNFLDPQRPDHRIGLVAGFSRPGKKLPALLAEAPLVEALSGSVQHVEVLVEEVARTGPLADQYNLLKHRGMTGQLALLAILAFYGIADFVLQTELLRLGDLPLWPFVSAGLLAAALAVRLGRGAPATERLGVGGLLVLGAMAATYPGLHRFAMLESPDPTPIAYRAKTTAVFSHPAYPTIDRRTDGIQEYWQTIPVNSTYTFQLHPSTLGFTLVNMQPVYERSRAFYRTQ